MVNIQPHVALGGAPRLTGMQSDPHLYDRVLGPGVCGKCPLDVHRGAHGIAGAGKDHEKGIALRVHLLPMPLPEGCSPTCCSRRVDPSISVKSRVRVPAGNSGITGLLFLFLVVHHLASVCLLFDVCSNQWKNTAVRALSRIISYQSVRSKSHIFPVRSLALSCSVAGSMEADPIFGPFSTSWNGFETLLYAQRFIISRNFSFFWLTSAYLIPRMNSPG
jgi:hypothetical protein